MKRTIIALLSTMLLITQCGATNAPNTDTDSSVDTTSSLPYYMEDFVDPYTGVHYLMDSNGITPRLNSDGTIMVTPKEE